MRKLRLTTFALVLVACIGCDQASKQVASVLLAGGDRIALLGDAIRFELVSNPGAFLSLGAGLPETLRSALLVGLVPVLLGVVLLGFAMRAQAPSADLVAVALLTGGGLGNWLDRLTHGGSVTDFVSIGLGPLRTGIFNLADVAVVAGVVLLLVSARARARAR